MRRTFSDCSWAPSSTAEPIIMARPVFSYKRYMTRARMSTLVKTAIATQMGQSRNEKIGKIFLLPDLQSESAHVLASIELN